MAPRAGTHSFNLRRFPTSGHGRPRLLKDDTVRRHTWHSDSRMGLPVSRGGETPTGARKSEKMTRLRQLPLTLRTFFIAASLLSGGMGTSPLPAAQSSLVATIALSSSTFRIGDPIVINTTVQNVGQAPMDLYAPRFGAYLQFLVVDQQGAVLYEDPSIDERSVQRHQLDDVRLQPNESWHGTYVLNHFVDITAPGTYTLQVIYPHGSHVPTAPRAQASPIASNVVTFQLTK